MSGVGRDPRVLVVEDDDEIAQVLQRSLRLDGYDVRIAGDGEAALDQAAAYHPDLVILDLGLPKLDGIELTQREFELLEYLMRNERLVVPRQRLLEEVWGYDPFATTNTIEVFVSNLRRKLESGGEARLLHTIRGAGYVLRD